MTTIEILRSVASHGVSGGGRSPASVDRAEAGDLIAEATAHKLIGLLDQAVADGAVLCDEVTAGEIGERAVEVAGWSVRLERHLLTVHELLLDHGLRHRFIKGSTIAHRFYSHPALRMSVDVDVLVPSAELEHALAVLAEDGHVRTQPDPYPGFSRVYGKSVTMRHSNGVEVDVHRVIADGPFGLRASADSLWERPDAWITLGGRAVPTLDPVAAFVHACVNAVASYDLVTLASLRDVVQVGTAVADQVPDVLEVADALCVQACLADAVARATTAMAWDAPAAIAPLADWSGSTRERQWLDSYREPPRDWRRVLLGWQAVPGLGAKVGHLGSAARLWAGRPSRRRDRGSTA